MQAQNDKPHSKADIDIETVKLMVHGRKPDPRREGVVDVISMRGLVRAIQALRGQDIKLDANKAFARIVNINGAVSKVIMYGWLGR